MNEVMEDVVLSIIDIVGTVVILAALVAVLYTLVNKLWSTLHIAMLYKVKLSKNLLRWGDEEDTRPPYLDAANKIRDVLAVAPRLYTIRGLGWQIVLVRDSKKVEKK